MRGEDCEEEVRGRKMGGRKETEERLGEDARRGDGGG